MSSPSCRALRGRRSCVAPGLRGGPFRRTMADACREGVNAMRVLKLSLLAAGLATPAIAAELNDYPTAARADYVLACMKANGETRHVLDQCSCSIDIIASVLPYDRYVMAEAVLSVGQVQGNLGAQFRSSEQAKSALNDLRRAQAEAEVRCF